MVVFLCGAIELYTANTNNKCCVSIVSPRNVPGCPSITPIPVKNDVARKEEVQGGRGREGDSERESDDAWQTWRREMDEQGKQHASIHRQSVRIPSLFLCR